MVSDVPLSTKRAAVLISIENDIAVQGIFRLSDDDTPSLGQQMKISTTTGMIDGSIINFDADFQPVPADKKVLYL